MAVSEIPTAATREHGESAPAETAVVWPDPSPLNDWWHQIMHHTRKHGAR